MIDPKSPSRWSRLVDRIDLEAETGTVKYGNDMKFDDLHAEFFDFIAGMGARLQRLHRAGAWGLECCVFMNGRYVIATTKVDENRIDRDLIDMDLFVALKEQIRILAHSTTQALVLYDPPPPAEPPPTTRDVRRALLQILSRCLPPNYADYETHALWRTVLVGAGFHEDDIDDLLAERWLPEATMNRRSGRRRVLRQRS